MGFRAVEIMALLSLQMPRLFQGAGPGGSVAYHFSCKITSRLNNGESSCHSWPAVLLKEDLGIGKLVFKLASDLGFSLLADSPEIPETTICFLKAM